MAYHDELIAAITEWNQNPIGDEWLFERFRERAINCLSPADAFNAIGDTVTVLVQQSDESTATEVVQTLIGLARQSDTTEVHPVLLNHVVDLMNQFASFGDYARGKLNELLRFYRLPQHRECHD